MGKLLRGITANKQVRIFVAETTDMVEAARKIHGTSPVATAALGRTLSATAIMGQMSKNEDERTSLQIKGDGEIKDILAVTSANGETKAYIHPAIVGDYVSPLGKLDVGKAVGNTGKIILTRDYGLKEPYVGQGELISGEIAEDIANFFMTSEQQPSVVSLGVFVGAEEKVMRAGGLIVQLLPFAEEETIVQLEKNFSAFPSMTTLLGEGLSIQEIMEKALEGLSPEVSELVDLSLTCDCSRERIESALASIGKSALTEILEEDGQAELGCHFCNTKYNFTAEDLENLIIKL